jgi:trimethylamine:corrinoid methyltransferase-like protein
MSAEMMIVQTAWLEAARHLCRGINFGEGRLGLGNIKAAGPGGAFLMDDLTLEYMRGGEFFQSAVFDMSGAEGKPAMLERAHARVEELTADAESPLPGQVQEDLRRYFRDEYRRCDPWGTDHEGIL